jgi:medium-chain acyl-[acyl-carrier-protein] hydrolase
VNAAASLPRTPWLVRSATPNPRMRLFCFPYAGGSAFNFTPWRDALDRGVEICALQLPGRGSRIAEPPIRTMPALLKAVAPVVAQYSQLPFAFFGHSVGALVAFELARYLRLHGVDGPMHLFASGCHAPQFRSPSRRLNQLPDDAFIEALREYNGTPREVLESRELMALMMPTIRADFALAEDYAYRPGPSLHAPISVFAGKDEDNKGPGQVDGWRKETTGQCDVSWFEGGHFFIDTARAAVLERLNAVLARMHATTRQDATADT